MKLDSRLSPEHQNLIKQVQHNCDISDANHAGNYTLCIYLLKMREYYRWIHALDFADNFESASMTSWLREKEEIWDDVVDEEFKTIDYNEIRFDPFDSLSLNQEISPQQLFYHAGIGQKAVQHFFIADLLEQQQINGVKVSITGTEYARDLTAPPAISTRHEIIVRRESLKRMCWERYQEWNWSRLENPMGTALSFYPFEQDIPLALDQITDVEQHTLVQHELGEMMISLEHGTQWSAMMLKLLGSKAELLSRAVRDHLADCQTTLPFLAEQQNPASIHFYFANLTYIRKDLFPSALQAYKTWVDDGHLNPLIDLAHKASEHWQQTLQAVLAIDAQSEQNPAAEIVELIESSRY